MVPLWFFMSLWMVDTHARFYVIWEPPALCINRETCLENLPPPQFQMLMKFRIFYKICEHTCGLVSSGIPATPDRDWASVSLPLPHPRGGGTRLIHGFPREQNQDRPVSSQLIPHSSLNMALRWILISGWQVSPTVLFLNLSNYSWAFYTNCRNCLKPSVWNLGQILVRISSNYWINFRELWCLYGLSLVNIGAIFLCFLEVRVNKLFPCTLTVPFRQSILGCLRRLFSLGWCCDWGMLSCYIFEVNAASPSSALSPPALLSNLALS